MSAARTAASLRSGPGASIFASLTGSLADLTHGPRMHPGCKDASGVQGCIRVMAAAVQPQALGRRVLQLHRIWQGKQNGENRRRLEHRELLSRAEKARRLLEGFSIFDFCTCNREMRIDLTALSWPLFGKIVEMRFAHRGIAAQLVQRTVERRMRRAAQFICPCQHRWWLRLLRGFEQSGPAVR